MAGTWKGTKDDQENVPVVKLNRCLSPGLAHRKLHAPPLANLYPLRRGGLRLRQPCR